MYSCLLVHVDRSRTLFLLGCPFKVGRLFLDCLFFGGRLCDLFLWSFRLHSLSGLLLDGQVVELWLLLRQHVRRGGLGVGSNRLLGGPLRRHSRGWLFLWLRRWRSPFCHGRRHRRALRRRCRSWHAASTQSSRSCLGWGAAGVSRPRRWLHRRWHCCPFCFGRGLWFCGLWCCCRLCCPFRDGRGLWLCSRICKGGAAFSLAFQPPLAGRDSCRELWHVGAEVGPVGTVGVVDADDRSNMCFSAVRVQLPKVLAGESKPEQPSCLANTEVLADVKMLSSLPLSSPVSSRGRHALGLPLLDGRTQAQLMPLSCPYSGYWALGLP